MNNINLKPKYLKEVQKILKLHIPDTEVWAYGSRVNGSSHDGSDLDLVVRNHRNLKRQNKNLATLKETFRESNLPLLIDIVDWANIPESFYSEIEKAYFVIQRKNGDVVR